MSTVSIIGLVGMSFSGSTVLNYVLGAHPGVYGGSELYRLIDTDPSRHCGCSWCHNGCAVLTKERIATLNKVNFYTSLAQFTGKNKIVDTSKNLPWFEDVFPRQEGQDVSLSLLLLTKHPLRQLAAYMGWERDYLYKCGLRSIVKRMLVDPGTAFSRQKMHLSYWLDVMIAFYDGFDSSPLARNTLHWRVKYEDFVTSTADALANPLQFLGLEFQPDAINYHTYEQHGVGGNGGVIRMINTQERIERFRNRSADYILDFYDNCEGLTLDNSFRDAFSQETIDWITDLPKYRRLCERLAYGAHIAE
ncbi:MAG: hypothetical protein V3573_01045 [Desulfovibrionaceae bacterium]